MYTFNLRNIYTHAPFVCSQLCSPRISPFTCCSVSQLNILNGSICFTYGQILYFRTEQQSTIIQLFIDRKWSVIMLMVLTSRGVNVCDEWISDWPYICWIGLRECVFKEIMWEISNLAHVPSACSLFITEACGL